MSFNIALFLSAFVFGGLAQAEPRSVGVEDPLSCPCPHCQVQGGGCPLKKPATPMPVSDEGALECFTCKIMELPKNKDGAEKEPFKVCFPEGKICLDHHGMGDGKPMERPCFQGTGRGCNPARRNWPECAGGIRIPLLKK